MQDGEKHGVYLYCQYIRLSQVVIAVLISMFFLLMGLFIVLRHVCRVYIHLYIVYP